MTAFSHRLLLLGLLIQALEILPCRAASPAQDYTIEVLSPDRRYGITVPNDFQSDAGNTLVEVKTGRAIVELESFDGEIIANHMNHGGFDGKWSADGTLLYWGAFGKWTSIAIDILKLKDGKVLWQKNLSPTCQKAILEKTKAADPKGYAREKKQNKGNGSHYPEGFTIDVQLDSREPLKLPLKVHVDLTSDVKAGAEPDDPRLPLRVDSWMEAVLNDDGRLVFGEFHMGRRPEPSKAFGG